MSVPSKRSKRASWSSLLWCVFAMFACVPPAIGIFAYLPEIGSPPLRIQETTTNSFNYLAFSKAFPALEARAAEALSNATSVAAATPASTNQNANAKELSISNAIAAAAALASNVNKSANVYVASSPANAMDEGTEMDKSGRQTPNFAFPGSSASDLLTVTPQMITQYLKPDVNETNQLDRPGVVVFVPADMPFMPPGPKNAPESRAIYQSR